MSFDIKPTSGKPAKPAELNCQAVAALQCRALAAEDPDEREANFAEVESILKKLTGGQGLRQNHYVNHEG